VKFVALRRFRMIVSSAASLGVGLSAVLVAGSPGVAYAAPTNAGTVYSDKASGVVATVKDGVTTQFDLVTTALCPSTSKLVYAGVSGGGFSQLADGFGFLVGAEGTSAAMGGSTSGYVMPVPNLYDFSKDQGVPWAAGDYTVSIGCFVIDYTQPEAVFTGTLHFSDASHWTMALPPGGGGPGATTTTVTSTPVGSAAPGVPVTFTATVNAAAAGSVQFKDGAVNLGSPVAVNVGATAATATYQSSTLTDGSHTITATFTPTDSAHFSGSTSTAVTFVITAARLTTITLVAAPQSPAIPGGTVAFTATVTPSSAVGSVVFKDGTTTLATVPVVNGTAAYATTALTGGDHSVVAIFTPTDPTQYTSSQSAVQTYTISTAQVSVTTLSLSPVGAAAPGDTVVLTANVQPTSAMGSVQFKDGTSSLGVAVPVTNGIATYASTTLPIGTRTLTAVFVPTVAASFAPSTSLPQYYFIGTGARTVTVLAANPPGPVPPRTSVTFTALLTPATAVGSVQFLDGTTALGTVNVTNGTASYIAPSLGIGTHPITAVFSPTDAAAYKGSTSSVLSFVVAVDAPPVFSTPAQVNGNASAGGTVSCDATVAGADVSYAPLFTWILDGAPVDGAVDHVFQIPLRDYGHLLQCQVSVSNARGTSRSPIGAAVKVAAAGRLVVTVRPILSGRFTVGSRIRVTAGSWSLPGATVTFQWYRDGRTIAHAHSSSYVLGKADRGHKVTCIVKAHAFAYSDGSAAPTARHVA
jgi:hypothetical protein